MLKLYLLKALYYEDFANLMRSILKEINNNEIRKKCNLVALKDILCEQ